VRVSGNDPDPGLFHGRQLLLLGAKREAVLDLSEVLRYGIDSYGDQDHVCVYGMPPRDWYAHGIRLLGRTAVECTVDKLGRSIAGDISVLVRSARTAPEVVVIDPFVGSGNTLYWIQRLLPGSRCLGFEASSAVFRLTQLNLAKLGADIGILNTGFAAGLTGADAPPGALVIAFVAPPWGRALDPVAGLDLRRTQPPVGEVVDLVIQRFPGHPLLIAVQVYERTDPGSVDELDDRVEWSDLHQYELFSAGQNHGLWLGTTGWAPGSAT
jgi:hypothetical protein